MEGRIEGSIHGTVVYNEESPDISFISFLHPTIHCEFLFALRFPTNTLFLIIVISFQLQSINQSFFHPLLMHMMNRMLQLVDRSTRIQILGASMRAVHNRMASIQLVRIVQTLQSLLRHLITGIGDPSVRLLQNRRTQVLISVPPVRRARRRAAGAENALVQTVQKQTVLVRLQILHLVVRAHRRFLLQPRLDRRVLLVEVRHV